MCNHCNDTGIIIVNKNNYLSYISEYGLSMIDRQFIVNGYGVLDAKCKYCDKGGTLIGAMRGCGMLRIEEDNLKSCLNQIIKFFNENNNDLLIKESTFHRRPEICEEIIFSKFIIKDTDMFSGLYSFRDELLKIKNVFELKKDFEFVQENKEAIQYLKDNPEIIDILPKLSKLENVMKAIQEYGEE